MAGNNSARYQQDGQPVKIEAAKLFDQSWNAEVDGMQFEAYPNRDSTPYAELYGLERVHDLLRGTLRNRGWSKIMMTLKQLGLTNPEPHGLTSPFSPGDLVTAASGRPDALAGIQEAIVKDALVWLGLDDTEPREWTGGSPLECLAEIMSDRMGYGPGERDMVVLRHDFEATFPDRLERITSSLVDFGIPGGSSSMARTVSLPLAIAAKAILAGEIELTGVRIPVDPRIYEPVLNELEVMNIKLVETTSIEPL
jgi:saccharopine dehydrogenase-like NADP-dependent oxidoreductase